MLSIIYQQLLMIVGLCLFFMYAPITFADIDTSSSDPELSATPFIVHKTSQIHPEVKTTKGGTKVGKYNSRSVQSLGCEYATSVRLETKVVDGEITKMMLYCLADSDNSSSQPYAFYKSSDETRIEGWAVMTLSTQHLCYDGQIQIEYMPKTNSGEYTKSCSVEEETS